MSDQQITCAECGNIFVFSASEQQFYSERGLAAPPKRCKGCRQARRVAQEGSGGGRDSRGGRGPNDRGARAMGNSSEHRSSTPNANGFRGAPIAPRGGGPNGRFSPRPSFGDRSGGSAGGASFGGGAAGGAGGDRGPRPPGRFDRGGSAPARFDGNGFNAPHPPRPSRPSFEGRGATSAPSQRERGGPSWGTRPNERTNERSRPSGGADGGQRPPRAVRGKDHPPAAPRETKPNERPPGTRPERPRYDITCGECGTQAQVPFKPLDGRQVFCQPCYRARKGPPAGSEAATGEPAAGEDTDAGIIE